MVTTTTRVNVSALAITEAVVTYAEMIFIFELDAMSCAVAASVGITRIKYACRTKDTAVAVLALTPRSPRRTKATEVAAPC
jgi:hypothetical protein